MSYPDIITQLLARMDEVERTEIVVTGNELLALREALASEVANREKADSDIKNDIGKEASAREEADTKLAGRIAKLEDGVTLDIDGDLNIGGNLNISGTFTADELVGVVYL